MVAATDSEGTKGFSGKKVSKPLMEKKRRARINRCLDQLKTLLETCYSNNIRKRKLEKADILELTVRHLRHLQKSRGGSTTHADSDYQAGFRSCLAGVNQYLLMTGTGGSNRSDMLAQLSSRCVRPDTRCEYFSTADSDPRTGRSADDSAQKLSAGILLQTTPVAMSSGSRVETTTKKKHGIALKTTQLPGKVCQTLPRTPVGVAATRNRQENGSAVDTPRDCTSTNGQHNDQYVMICSDSYWRPW